VTCSGATTAHLLGPWRELPAQLDALTPETALVTITIGGNDIGYIASLFAASCAAQPKAAICARITAPPPVTTAQWQSLAQNFAAIAAEVRRRAPRARLVFVDYLTVLPPTALCPETPMSPAQAAQGRALARKLARLTARAARKAGATLIPASTASASHHACAKTPWMTGFTPPPGAQGFVPYHPNQPGMTAVAKALEAALSPRAAPSAAR
jgi:lysophospholipase L1-like esterase